MKINILTLIAALFINWSGKTQNLEAKQDIYFIMKPNASYIYQYRKIDNATKFDLEITFNKSCLVMGQKPYFYRYKDSTKTISKSGFCSRNTNILTYKKFSDLICSQGNDASIIIKYNIFFIQEAENNKYIISKVQYATPVPDDRKDNVIVEDSTLHH